MEIFGVKLSTLQIFSIAAILIFIGSMAFMYTSPRSSAPKQNVTYAQGTVIGHALFFMYKPYIYFNLDSNISESVLQNIDKYVDYIDFKKGVISLKDSSYERDVFNILSDANITAYVPTEFILEPEAKLTNDKGTVNLTLKTFKFQIPTKMEFKEGDMVAVSIPAILRNNQILRYGNPQLQVTLKSVNVSARVVGLEYASAKCSVRWDSQFELYRRIHSMHSTHSGVQNTSLNLTPAMYFYTKSAMSSDKLSALRDLPFVSMIHGQTVYIRMVGNDSRDTHVNMSAIYEIINVSDIVLPDVSLRYTVQQAQDATCERALESIGLSNESKDIILDSKLYYVYTVETNDSTRLTYPSTKILHAGDLVSVERDVYMSGNTVIKR